MRHLDDDEFGERRDPEPGEQTESFVELERRGEQFRHFDQEPLATFGTMPLGDVAQHDRGEHFVAGAQLGDGGLGGELLSVLPLPGDFPAFAHAAGDDGRLHERLDVAPVSGASTGRQQEIQGLSYDLIGAVAEDLGRSLVEENDPVVASNTDDRIGRDTDDFCQKGAGKGRSHQGVL